MSCLLLIALPTGCRGHYQEYVPPPSPIAIDPGEVLVVGVRNASTGQIDEAATRLLMANSGLESSQGTLGADELALLLADPLTLAMSDEERSALREQVGRQYVLVGDVTATPVDERKQWVIAIPVLIPFVGAIGFLAFPKTYSREPDAPHTAVVLRVVDLDSGRIAAEFLAVANQPAGQATLTENAVEAGMQKMKLRSNR